MSDAGDSKKPVPRGSDIRAAQALERLLERRGAKIPPWVHNLARTPMPRPQAGHTEMQYRLVQRSGEVETPMFDFISIDDEGLRAVAARHEGEDVWLEQREVVVTPWERTD